MKLTLTQEQVAYIKSLDCSKKRKEFFLTAIIENIIRESEEPVNDNPKQYTEEDMQHAFSESRLTHSIFGFKHGNFEEYIDSLKNPS